jgi:hypothetical protein
MIGTSSREDAETSSIQEQNLFYTRAPADLKREGGGNKTAGA